jgi:hypothetical protein
MADWNGEEIAFEQTTPNGWVIRYEPTPFRRYLIDGEQVKCSASEPLKVLNKEALSWWGQCIGIAGIMQLYTLGLDMDALVSGKPPEMEWYEYAKLFASGPLTDHELSTNHVREKAGVRGKTVHNALEQWAVDGLMPVISEYPDHEQGYVVALTAFLRDCATLRAEGAEIVVGSKEHSFAGRFDLRARLEEPTRVVTKVYPKAAAKTTTIPAGTFLWDLKTAVDVFPEQSLQLGGYELASVESGWEPTSGQAIIQLGTDGRYQCRQSKSTGEDFLAIKACWETYHRVEEALKIPYRIQREETAA